MNKRLVFVALCLTAIGAVACGGDDGDADTGGDSAAGANGGESSVEVQTADFAFEPADVSVAAGGTIELTNEDDTKHSLTAEEAGVDEDVDAMSSTSVDVGDAAPGTYDFICKYHPDMKGTLEITE